MSTSRSAPPVAPGIPGSLLAHVAFHFVPARAPLLGKVLRTLQEYEFSTVDIVVDTNCGRGADVARELSDEKQIGSRIHLSSHVHADLPHPFVLTWMHRRHMRERLGSYDFFMYLEDDVRVPWEGILAWHHDTALLYSLGFLRGFLRVETSPRGVLVATDVKRPRAPVVRIVAGRPFFHPQNPYCGFWIYTREQMEEFVNSDSWVDPPWRWDIREKAAAGMVHSNLDRVDHEDRRRSSRRPSRTLVPLDASWRPAETALVHHLTNSYAIANAGRHRRFGTVPVSRIFGRRFWLTRRLGLVSRDRPTRHAPVA